MKKRSAKAACQRDDRAFAEFEAMTRKLAKAPKRDTETERAKSNDGKPTR